jgi:hypothetical protein
LKFELKNENMCSFFFSLSSFGSSSEYEERKRMMDDE